MRDSTPLLLGPATVRSLLSAAAAHSTTPHLAHSFSRSAPKHPTTAAIYRLTCKQFRAGQLVNQTEIYSDGFGDWISGYTPNSKLQRRDRRRVRASISAADYVASGTSAAILNSVVVAFILTYAFLFGTVWLISRTLSEPIISLTRIAQHGSAKATTIRICQQGACRPAFRDEIDTLADVFRDHDRQGRQTRGKYSSSRSPICKFISTIPSAMNRSRKSSITTSSNRCRRKPMKCAHGDSSKKQNPSNGIISQRDRFLAAYIDHRIPVVVVCNISETFYDFLSRADDAEHLIRGEQYRGDRAIIWAGDPKLVFTSLPIPHAEHLYQQAGLSPHRISRARAADLLALA